MNTGRQSVADPTWAFRPARNKLYHSVALAMASAVLTPLTIAQENSAVKLEEVVVTAQRRVENLQTVPIAVTAFSGEDLRKQGIWDVKGVSERTPGFTMGEFNPGQPQLYIRGIGSNEDGAAGDQSVAVFVDEFYIGRSAGQDVELFDLERVEVLRGPQGTLFGRNVVGGAISITTKKPTEENELILEGSYGNYNAVTLQGLASGQVAENLYGKTSFSSRRRDGYLDNQIGNFASFFEGSGESVALDQDEVRKVDRSSLRTGLRWVPTDDVEVNLGANYSTVDEDAAVRHYIEGVGVIVYPAHNALIPNYDDDIYKVLTDDIGSYHNDIYSLTARVDWHFNSDYTFTSLTSYRDVDATNLEHGLGTPRMADILLSAGATAVAVDGFNDYTDESQTFSQELRLTSNTGGRLEWVAGLYYLQEDVDRTETASVGIKVPIGNGVYVGPNSNNTVSSDAQEAESTSYAVFGQATYQVTDALGVTLGGRWTRDEKEINRIGVPDGVSVLEAFDVSADASWEEFTMKANVGYQLTNDAYLYATFSEGYKAGGYQGLAATEVAAETPFDPEYATMYEVGAKTEWLDNRLRINIAAFMMDYEDMQILQSLVRQEQPPEAVGNLVTQNAADSEIEGYELEFVFAVTEGLTLQGSVAHLDTEFKEFFVPSGFRPQLGADTNSRVGNELRNAPDMAYNMLARYEQGLDNGSQMAYQVEYIHKDEASSDPDNVPFGYVPEYDLTHARISWMSANGGLEVAAWVQNLFDEEYFIHNYPAVGDGFATPGPPRMYGVTFTWRNQ